LNYNKLVLISKIGIYITGGYAYEAFGWLQYKEIIEQVKVLKYSPQQLVEFLQEDEEGVPAELLALMENEFPTPNHLWAFWSGPVKFQPKYNVSSARVFDEKLIAVGRVKADGYHVILTNPAKHEKKGIIGNAKNNMQPQSKTQPTSAVRKTRAPPKFVPNKKPPAAELNADFEDSIEFLKAEKYTRDQVSNTEQRNMQERHKAKQEKLQTARSQVSDERKVSKEEIQTLMKFVGYFSAGAIKSEIRDRLRERKMTQSEYKILTEKYNGLLKAFKEAKADITLENFLANHVMAQSEKQ